MNIANVFYLSINPSEKSPCGNAVISMFPIVAIIQSMS